MQKWSKRRNVGFTVLVIMILKLNPIQILGIVNILSYNDQGNDKTYLFIMFIF